MTSRNRRHRGRAVRRSPAPAFRQNQGRPSACSSALQSKGSSTRRVRRDKIAASKQKGMWMGGLVPLGYEVQERRLMVNELEAETVREIFRRYLELGCVRLLMEDLNRRGIRSKVRVARNGKTSGGNSFFRGALYVLLSNPIYIGEIRHKAFSRLSGESLKLETGWRR